MGGGKKKNGSSREREVKDTTLHYSSEKEKRLRAKSIASCFSKSGKRKRAYSEKTGAALEK